MRNGIRYKRWLVTTVDGSAYGVSAQVLSATTDTDYATFADVRWRRPFCAPK